MWLHNKRERDTKKLQRRRNSILLLGVGRAEGVALIKARQGDLSPPPCPGYRWGPALRVQSQEAAVKEDRKPTHKTLPLSYPSLSVAAADVVALCCVSGEVR